MLKKVNGSLGFMLRKEDESVLGHCVRALVREPALSDGRIRPGDKIVTVRSEGETGASYPRDRDPFIFQVNGVDISPMSHEEAVMYLRQCGEEVRLRLYRDPAQTPVSALSPTESYKSFRPKPVLRKEAMDMLCDLAVKKLSPSDSSSSSGRSRLRGSSPGSSPRRRKLKKSPTEDGDDRPQRPDFLDLCRDGPPGRGPEEDADSVLTATSGSEVTQTTVGSATRACLSSDECNSEDGTFPAEPASMPPLTASSSGFSYKNPAYQSAHPTVHSETESSGERLSDQDIPDGTFDDGGGGSHGLLKWKGVLFTPEDDVDVVAEEKKTKHSEETIPEDGEVGLVTFATRPESSTVVMADLKNSQFPVGDRGIVQRMEQPVRFQPPEQRFRDLHQCYLRRQRCRERREAPARRPSYYGNERPKSFLSGSSSFTLTLENFFQD